MINERKMTKQTDVRIGTYVVIVLLALCSLAAGFVPRNEVLSYVVVALCVVMIVKDELFLIYPFLIFYNDWYGTAMGISLQRIFCLCMLFAVLIRRSTSKAVNVRYFLPLAVYLLYTMTVVSDQGTKHAIFAFMDVLCTVLLVSTYLIKNPGNLRRFFKVYVLAALCAIFTGMMHKSVMVYGELSRFLATFEDPNYMGLFYTLAIFAMVSLRLFRPWVRMVLIGLFYITIAASASLSAILMNVVLWLIYITVTQRMRLSTFAVCGLVIALLAGLYSYGLAHPESGVIGQLSSRVEETLTKLSKGDFGGATTSRTEYVEEHILYFQSLPFGKQLIGGTAVNTSYIDPRFEAAAHNEYVDMLLNVGILGTVVLVGFVVVSAWKYLKAFYQVKTGHYLCLFMMKCVWLLYAFSLTMFLEDRFMLLFFV